MLLYLGAAAYLSGDRATARAHLEESLKLLRQQGDVLYASIVLNMLEVMVSSQGDEEMARSLYQQSLPLMQQARNRGAIGLFLINIGDMWLHLEMAPLLHIFIFIIMSFQYVILDTKSAKRRCLNGYQQRLLRLCGCTGLSTPHALRKITSTYFMIAPCH